MPKQPTPEVGDFWEDTDPRCAGRRVKVVEVGGGPKVVCETRIGRQVKIGRDRMEKGQGWRLVERWAAPVLQVVPVDALPPAGS